MAVAIPTKKGSITATIDTGATISSINARHALDVNVKEIIGVRGVGGQISSLGTTRIEFRFPNITMIQKLHVLPDECQLPNGLILGMDFLQDTEARIDIPKRKLHLYLDEDVDLDLIMEQGIGNEVNFVKGTSKANILLPARSEVRCSIPFETAEKEVVILPQELPDGIFLAGSWSKVMNGKLNVTMVNPSLNDVFLTEFLPIARPANDYEIVKEMRKPTEDEKLKRWETLKPLLSTKNLTKEETELVQTLCKEFADVFHLPGDKLTTTSIAKQTIHLKPGVAPKYVKPYRNPFHQKDLILDHVRKMEEDGVIEPSVSAWNAPLLIVPKKGTDADGNRQYRVVLDYRCLNTVLQLDRYPLPNIRDVVDQLGDSRIFTNIDLSQGYFQVELEKESRPCTAFITPDGKHYQMKRLPMGLNISPSAFSRVMALALTGLTGTKCLVYLDDLIVFSRNKSEHYKDLKDVFQRLRDVNLKIHPRKSNFFQAVILFLGYKISKDGVEVDPEKCRKIKDWPQPKTKKQLQSFLGLANFYRHFVKNFAEIATPLNRLTGKRVNFEWDDACQGAFEALKEALCSTDVLAFPNFDHEFVVTTDASMHSLGAVLANYDDRPIHFASRTMKPAELNYATIEKECLGVVFGLKTFRQYLLGKHFLLKTDHAPLVWLFGMNNPASRLTKFRLELEQFYFSIEYVKGRDNVVADALSRISIEELKGLHRQVEKHAEAFSIFAMTRAQAAIANKSPLEFHIPTVELPKPPRHARLLTFSKNERNPPKIRITESKLWISRNFDENAAEMALRQELDVLNDRPIAVLVDNEADTKNALRMLARLRLRVVAVPRPRFVEAPEEQMKLIQEAHDSLVGGHMGILRTLRTLKRRYYWPRMVEDITDYINGCIKCKEMKKLRGAQARMTITDNWQRPMSSIQLDLVGPLPGRSIRYILTIECQFSKFIMAIPLRTKESKEVAEAFVEKWVLLFGAPESILCDLGKEFMKTFIDTCALLKIPLKTSTAYHHETLGGIENSHKMLGNFLRAFAEKVPDWPKLLPIFQFAYNNSVHGSMQYAPSEIVFPFQTFVPAALRQNAEGLSWPRHYDAYVDKLEATMKIICAEVTQGLIDSKMYNVAKSHQSEQILRVGDNVMLRRGNRKKMDPIRNGPFEVRTVNWPNVTLEDGRKVHADRLMCVPTRNCVYLAAGWK